jgi:hypothetical protein
MGVEGRPERNDLSGASGTGGMSWAHLRSIAASAACACIGRTRKRKRPVDTSTAEAVTTVRRLQTLMA